MKHKAILKHSFLILGLFVLLMFGCIKKERSTNKASGTLTDINGNIYHTVTIGTQVWTVENLKTTKFRNGDSVPNVTGVSQWSFSTTNGWCYYDNNKDKILNKLKNQELIKCGCGAEIQKSNNKHVDSKKHKKLFEKNNNTDNNN